MNERLSRRDVLHRSAAFGVLAVVGAACGKSEPKGPSCADTTSLSASDAQVRTQLSYVDTAPDPTKACASCQQFLPAAPDTCGGCKILKGPISPRGNCKSFLAKPT
jgi:hypothetical protein